MVSRGGRPTAVPSGLVTLERSMISRATVLPSSLSSRVTLIRPAALATGSSARGLASLTIWSRTGPAGRSLARCGRAGLQPGTACSAWVMSSLVSSRRPPRRACSYSSTSPARFSRQSKVSSQVRWRVARPTPAPFPFPFPAGSAAMAKVVARAASAAETGSPLLLFASGSRRSGVICSASPSGESYRRSPYAWYTPALADGPCLSGGGEDISGPGHGRLGPCLGDSGGGRGGRGPDRVLSGQAGRDGGGERADEGVAGAHGVDGLDGEALDDGRAVGSGQGGTVRARGDDGVPRAGGQQFGGGAGRVGKAADRVTQDGLGFGFVHHQPAQMAAVGGHQGGGLGRSGGQVEDAFARLGQGGLDRVERDLGADDQDVVRLPGGGGDLFLAGLVVGARRDRDDVLAAAVHRDHGQAGRHARGLPHAAGVHRLGFKRSH